MRHGASVAVAESCTGGLIGYRLTAVSGSSRYVVGGTIAYANRVKIRELGVPEELLARDGAVSAAVAECMARGVRERFETTFGLASTGIAGPEGGVEGKPVGLVFVALAHPDECTVKRCVFDGDREAVRRAAAATALEILIEFLEDKEMDHGKEE